MCKRILTIAAIVLAVYGLALAGNTSTITQTGSGNNASATQSGNLNVASIKQVANTSTATQKQTGTSNNATMEQVGWDWSTWPIVPEAASVSETGYQEQLGTGNIATLLQWANAGTGGNNGNQYQDNRAGGAGNTVYARQYTINSTVDQDQIGSNNWAFSSQIGFQQRVVQYQSGNNNKAWVDEQTGKLDAGGQIAEQRQTGNDNTSVISQSGPIDVYDKNTVQNQAYVTQTGNNNYAGTGWYNQNMPGVTQRGSYNYAEVEQKGDDNTSDPILDCAGVNWTPLGGFVTIGILYQHGNSNYAHNYIEGSDNETAQYQNGNSNDAYLDIITGDGNQAKQVQLDDLNFSDIDINGNSNQAGTYQDGGHSATIDINGSGNNAYVLQQ